VDQDAATIAIVVSLAIGYYFARWRRWERSVRGAKRELDGAKQNRQRARGVMLFVGVFAVLAIRAWLHGSGRG
jgi:hypothetical protein